MKAQNLLKRAFLNQYNMILLGGSGAMAAASQHWLPLIVGAGLETLWLVLGSDAMFFKRWVNVQDGIALEAKRAKAVAEVRASLDVDDAARIAALEILRDEIAELAASADASHREIIQPELDKMAALLESFVRLAALRERLEVVRKTAGARELEREVQRAQRDLQVIERRRNASPALRTSLTTHLQLCQKRLQSLEDLRSQAEAIGVQLDTIEQTFAYLKTNVANMASPEAFSNEIDNVLNGIEAAEKTFAETERLEMLRQASALGSTSSRSR